LISSHLAFHLRSREIPFLLKPLPSHSPPVIPIVPRRRQPHQPHLLQVASEFLGRPRLGASRLAAPSLVVRRSPGKFGCDSFQNTVGSIGESISTHHSRSSCLEFGWALSAPCKWI
jgi:hypothetical protein